MGRHWLIAVCHGWPLGGKQPRHRDRVQLFKSGCGVENASHIYCKAIVDNDKVIAVGFEIVTSDNRIALYQPKQTKILKLGDAVIEVMRPEDFRRYEASLPKP